MLTQKFTQVSNSRDTNWASSILIRLLIHTPILFKSMILLSTFDLIIRNTTMTTTHFFSKRSPFRRNQLGFPCFSFSLSALAGPHRNAHACNQHWRRNPRWQQQQQLMNHPTLHKSETLIGFVCTIEIIVVHASILIAVHFVAIFLRCPWRHQPFWNLSEILLSSWTHQKLTIELVLCI